MYKQSYRTVFIIVFLFLLISNASAQSLSLFERAAVSRCRVLFSRNNFIKAYRYCLKNRKEPSGSNEYFLGVMAFNGYGTSQDKNEAVEYFKSSAIKGNKNSINFMGKYYISKNQLESASYWYEYLKNNDEERISKLSEIYQDLYRKKPTNVLYNKVSSLLFSKNAFNDSVILLLRARSYEYGIGVAKNEKRAIQYYQSFLRKGINVNRSSLLIGSYLRYAQTQLGILQYQLGNRGVSIFNLLTKGRKTALSSYYIAHFYKRGFVVQKSNDQYLRWLNVAIKKGSIDALIDLSDVYLNGVIIKKDYKIAFQLMNRAARKNNVKAIVLLARMYEKGKGVTRSYITAEHLYTKAKRLNPQLANKLILEYSPKEPKRVKFSKQCLSMFSSLYASYDKPYAKITYGICKKAFNLGDIDSTLILARMHHLWGFSVPVNKKKYVTHLHLAAKRLSLVAIFSLAQAYRHGNYDLKINTKQALKYFLLYLENASNPKMRARVSYNVFEIYEEMKKNNEKYSSKALDYLRESVNLGSFRGLYSYAWYLWDGNRISKNQAKAIALWQELDRKAIKTGYNNLPRWRKWVVDFSRSELCFIYNGIDSPKRFVDFKKAFSVCSRATVGKYSRSRANALYALGRMYYYGYHVKVNKDIALRYLDEAHELGNIRAQSLLSKMKSDK